MTQPEENQIQEENSSKHYRTEIPNLVFHLGLTAHEIALYLTLKRSAGATSLGACSKKTATLASESGMSAGMVSKTKESLLRSRPLLSEKPLIKITKVKNPAGGKAFHKIMVVDIWDDNYRYFLDLKDKKRAISRGEIARNKAERASSQDEIASSCGEIAISPHEIKKNNNKEKQKSKESNASTALFRLSDKQSKNYEALIKAKVKEETAAYWARNYTTQQIRDAFDVLAERQKKGIKIKNEGGFIRRALNEEWKPFSDEAKRNRSFAVEFQKKNQWNSLVVTEKYATIPSLGIDLYFKLPAKLFKQSLVEKFRICAIYGESKHITSG